VGRAHARNFNVGVREEGHDIIFLYRLEPGGADRSYGIHVGRLAGLPTQVVERAGAILTMLEAGHHVAGQEPPPRVDRSQLPLFAPEPHPVLEALRTLDPNSMTPLEALSRLADLKRRAEAP
jgi:DNA mismatch repair protein MutS